MKLIQCPDSYMCPTDGTRYKQTCIFVAGGISNCPDWQKEMVQRFNRMDDNFIMFNPRRNDFDITDPTMSAKQIEWEYNHLCMSDAVLFWFPYQTLCPITLYELGMQLGAQQNEIFVGCHPAYQRKFDLEHQLMLAGHERPVVTSFEELVNQVTDWYNR